MSQIGGNEFGCGGVPTSEARPTKRCGYRKPSSLRRYIYLPNLPSYSLCLISERVVATYSIASLPLCYVYYAQGDSPTRGGGDLDLLDLCGWRFLAV